VDLKRPLDLIPPFVLALRWSSKCEKHFQVAFFSYFPEPQVERVGLAPSVHDLDADRPFPFNLPKRFLVEEEFSLFSSLGFFLISPSMFSWTLPEDGRPRKFNYHRGPPPPVPPECFLSGNSSPADLIMIIGRSTAPQPPPSRGHAPSAATDVFFCSSRSFSTYPSLHFTKPSNRPLRGAGFLAVLPLPWNRPSRKLAGQGRRRRLYLNPLPPSSIH